MSTNASVSKIEKESVTRPPRLGSRVSRGGATSGKREAVGGISAIEEMRGELKWGCYGSG
jgi:hypothetical protein